MYYEEYKNDPFHFQEELLRYCRSDVDILRQSCLKLRQMFIDIATKNGSGIITVFTVFQLLTDFACLYTYEF